MASLTLLALLLALAAPTVHAADSSKWPTKRSSDPEWGEDKYTKHCWHCHGAEGNGDGPAAADLLVEVPSLRGLSNNDTRGDLVTTVRQGRGAMPSYHESISRQDVRRIFVYLEGLDNPKKKPAADEEPEESPLPENDAPTEEGNAPDAEGGE